MHQENWQKHDANSPWLIQKLVYFCLVPSVRACTNTMFLYPRLILILSSLYLQQHVYRLLLMVSGENHHGIMQFDSTQDQKSYSNSRLILVSISTGSPNMPAMMAASSILTSYVLGLDFLQIVCAISVLLAFLLRRSPQSAERLTQMFLSWRTWHRARCRRRTLTVRSLWQSEMEGVEGEGVRMWFVKKIEHTERFNMKKNIDILCAYLLSH